MFRALILDWSGTLVDDLAPTLDATNAVLGRFDLPAMSRQEFQDRFRLPYPEFYEEVLPGVPLADLEDHFREAFSGSEHEVTPLDGTREFLEWCSGQGIRLFVLTSMDTGEFERQLCEFGFEEHFEATYSGVLDKRSVIGEIIGTHGLRVDETAYVGDMVHDIETALHGGVTPVGVLSGYDPESRLSAAGPKLLLGCVKSLHAMLERARAARTGGELIEVRRLEVETHIGVPDEERAGSQRLLVSLEVVPMVPFSGLGDEIGRTVDYFVMAQRVKALASERPRNLIETLAVEIADLVLAEFAAAEVRVLIEKFVLPDTECVAVRTVRRR